MSLLMSQLYSDVFEMRDTYSVGILVITSVLIGWNKERTNVILDTEI